MSRRLSPSYPGSGSSPFASPLMGRREWQSGPAPFQNQRYPQGSMYGEQMRYGEPYPFNDRRGGSDTSSWVRPPTQPDEMYKLESVMRRAAQDNSSSLEAVRQVEKMGLGSVVGAILNAVDRRNPGFPAYESPSRGIPPLMEESYGRDPRLSGGLDYNPSPIRDISRYVEPLDDFCDRYLAFGQSYPAFAAQSFGGMMDYGSRGRSPAGRSYR
ncbi:hypothetical protein TELCIR_15972 [Teladorsagia circumcincta]|uniref:Uncharacterized protein n=1 Tax=Teladorsagia circumcincta TaxID=45464 RepID=A0A2G9TWW8_TELCI|nr:hypothetical protein TELCIR_15972 [Teladorsagia circumcincta]